MVRQRSVCTIGAVSAATIALILGAGCSSGSDAPKSDHDADREHRAIAATRDTTGAARLADPSKAVRPHVTLAPAAYANAGIEIAAAVVERAGARGRGLELPAVVTLDPSRIAIVSPRTAGRLERLDAVVGDHVAAGATVAYLTSPGYLTAESDYQQARSRAAALANTVDEAGARALLAAARSRLVLMGASSSAIARLDNGGEPSLTLPVTAPFGGNILESLALPGTAVEPGTPLFRIADLSALDVVAQVPQQVLAAVHPGQRAVVTVPAFSAVQFTGRVVRLQDIVDSATRTLGAVVRVANTGSRLRPGMFATVRLTVAAAVVSGPVDVNAFVTVPESAIITDGMLRYVFVEVAPRTFERRTVVVDALTPAGSMAPTSGLVVVRSGIAAGDRIVVRGAFTLESELVKATLGEDKG